MVLAFNTFIRFDQQLFTFEDSRDTIIVYSGLRAIGTPVSQKASVCFFNDHSSNDVVVTANSQRNTTCGPESPYLIFISFPFDHEIEDNS